MLDNSKRTQHILTMSAHVDKLAPLGEVVEMRKDTYFIKAGTKPEYCYIIKKGRIISSETYSNGKTRNGLIMTEGCILGESYLWLDEPCPTNFKTIEDSKLIRIPKQVFFDFVEENPDLYKPIIESLSKKLMSVMDELRQMAGCNVTWRICNLLLVFAESYGKQRGKAVCIDTHLTQQHIAQMLYTNRITIVRVFKKLQELNLITRVGNRYYITDIDALKKYMDLVAYSDKV